MSTDATEYDARPFNGADGSGSDQDSVPLQTLVDVIGAQQQTVRDLTQGLERALRELQDARGDGGRQTAELLALQLRHGANPLTRAASDQIRNYSELRSHLGGPQDLGVMVQARIQAIIPPHARIGDKIMILLENAGTPTSVAFTGPDGSTVRNVEIERGSNLDPKGNPLPVQCIQVKVPVGAVTGPITVVTDQGEPTSLKPFYIDTSRPRGLATKA